MTHAAITLSTETTHNPGAPRHFMRLKPAGRRVRILRQGEVLAETDDALRLVEVGKDVYDPTLYLPEADIRAGLRQTDKATHCPLKGDAVYFDLLDADGNVVCPEIAWAYPAPFDFADALAGRIAFYSAQVTVEESPL